MLNRKRAQPQLCVSVRMPPEVLAYLDALVAHYRDLGRPWTRVDVLCALLQKAKAPEQLVGLQKAAFPEGVE